jgi:putative transposase
MMLRAPPSLGRRSEADAPDRHAAHGFPFAPSRALLRNTLPGNGQPDAAGPARPARVQGRAVARCHADETDGHRGPLPAAKHLETGAGAQDLSLFAAKAPRYPTQPGPGDGQNLRPDGPRLHLPCCRAGLVDAARPGNVFVERLWRTINYEEASLQAYASVSEARTGIGMDLAFCNTRRPHSSLDGKTPDQAYLNKPIPEAAAA